jgi:hypothetical protein
MGLERESCEYDLLLIRPERNPPATLRIGDVFVDLAFSTESELIGARSPEVAVSLAFVRPIRDRDLVLSGSSSAARESLERNYQRCAEGRLASSVKGIGRADVSRVRFRPRLAVCLGRNPCAESSPLAAQAALAWETRNVRDVLEGRRPGRS